MAFFTRVPRALLYKKNNVPYYQALYQRHDGVRQWNKTASSKWMLYPYYFLFAGSITTTMYAMGRMVFGHRTWFSKG